MQVGRQGSQGFWSKLIVRAHWDSMKNLKARWKNRNCDNMQISLGMLDESSMSSMKTPKILPVHFEC